MTTLDRLPPPALAADESTVAVLAHVLLNDLTVVVGASATLREHPELDLEKRQNLLAMIEYHGELAARLVETLARGVPGDLDVLYAIGAITEVGSAPPV